MTFVEIFLLALSLSADSFVVSMSGSVTLGRIGFGRVLSVAAVFGLVQASFMLAGWALGSTFVSYITKVAHFVGFILLAYIGGSMTLSSIRRKGDETVDLSGFLHLLIAAIATSIDAVAVGVSLAMSGLPLHEMLWSSLIVFAVTFAVAAAGVTCGCAAGRRFGRTAGIAGGIVLILIGLKLLLG